MHVSVHKWSYLFFHSGRRSHCHVEGRWRISGQHFCQAYGIERAEGAYCWWTHGGASTLLVQAQHHLYHRAMDPVIAEINKLCKTARYYRWADKLVRLGQPCWHIISMDWLKIAATALTQLYNGFDWMECPTCQCPKHELDRTDKLYPFRSPAAQQMSVMVLRKHVQSSSTVTEASRANAWER